MEFRRLGRSGVKVSPLGLGTARLAGLDETLKEARLSTV
jgi:aryl-alcohol dehydrogenase-like predicted oxidoreductase